MVWEGGGREAPPYPDVCRAWSTARRCKSSIQSDGDEGLAKRKGAPYESKAHREVEPEGSVEQSCGPMNKNRIRGLPGRTSEHLIAKSTAIKDRGGISGGRAVKAVDLTSGDLRGVSQ